MGLALGAGIVAGVRAGVVGSLAEIALVMVAMALLVGVAPRPARIYAALAAAGLLLGAVVGFIRSPAEPTLTAPVSDRVEGRVASDPRSSPAGSFADLSWLDANGAEHESILFLPTGSQAGRGDWVEVDVRSWGGSSELIFARRARVIEPAGRVEQLRRRIRGSITERGLERAPGSPGSLALGLLIGDDSGLTREEREDMRASGLSHITAVSGSNVSMVIIVVSLVLSALGRRGWLWVGLQVAGVMLYVWIVGYDPPIVRAAIMGTLALVAIGLGRPAHLLTLLVLSAAAMAAHDPDVLASLSFQLSFLSMIALALVGSWMTRLERRSHQLTAAIASPAAAAIATAPLLAARFGTFSLGTIPANVIVAPIVAPATALSAIVAAIPDWAVVGPVVGVFLWLLTSLILEVSRTVASVPYAYWTFAPLDPGSTIGIYGLLIALAAPLVPEARSIGRSLGEWARARPAVAASTALAGFMLVAALVAISN